MTEDFLTELIRKQAEAGDAVAVGLLTYRTERERLAGEVYVRFRRLGERVDVESGLRFIERPAFEAALRAYEAVKK